MSRNALVKTSHLSPGQAIPYAIEPVIPALDLPLWTEDNTELVKSLLVKHRALLFRGFDVKSAGELEKFARATTDSELLEYRDRSTPRYTVGNRIYVSTIYPPDQSIALHNEGTYWKAWALQIYFCCLEVPEQGGQTPIANVANVFRAIDPKLRQQFIERKIMYVRNYNDGCGLPWQDVFQTSAPAEVESYCRENDVEFMWKSGGRLRTLQVRPAVRTHPWSGEQVWFNHAAFFHISSQEPEVRKVLQESFADDDLPFNTYYGDGTPIEPSVIAHVRGAYEQEKVIFDWKAGDVMLLDNMSVAHGREPYAGSRQVIVAMTDPYSGSR